MLKLEVVPTEEMGLYWPVCEKRIGYALDYTNGALTPIFLLSKIMAGELLFVRISNEDNWIGEIVLERLIYPEKKRLSVCSLSGVGIAPRIPELIGIILEFCQLIGFDGLEAIVRPGLAAAIEEVIKPSQSMKWMCYDVGRR